MVLAKGEELDVLDDDHLVVLDLKQSVMEHRVDVHGVAAGKEGHGLFDTLGGVEQPVACGILSDAQKQFAIEFLRGERCGGERLGACEYAHGRSAFRWRYRELKRVVTGLFDTNARQLGARKFLKDAGDFHS